MTTKDQILRGCELIECLLYKESIASLDGPITSTLLITNPFKRVTERMWFGDGRPYAFKLVGELALGVTVKVEFDHPVTDARSIGLRHREPDPRARIPDAAGCDREFKGLELPEGVLLP